MDMMFCCSDVKYAACMKQMGYLKKGVGKLKKNNISNLLQDNGVLQNS
ncbi:MAG: hypothetical protein J6T69_01940 [Methanobrevibacter sp.]|nr:hypothetical protein [Methanobrevibacter sp.]